MRPRSRNLAGLAVAVVSLGVRDGAAQAPPAEGPLGPEILHMPKLEETAEQGILRPVAVSATLPREVALRARRVLVHYRLWGDPDWTSLEMRREGARYHGIIPCLEISTVTGDLRYYIRVHDVEGRVIAAAASRAEPYRVTIKNDWALTPGAKRQAKCPDPSDCPRGLPGCPSERVVRIRCKVDQDCEGGSTCGWDGYCERVERRRAWVSVSATQDVGILATSGACSIRAQETEGFACYREDGEQYLGNPVLTNEPVRAGRGPTRLVVGFDYLLHYDISLGLRAGWVVAGEGPTPRGAIGLVPLSVAARATHWFGTDPFARSGARPYAFVAAGYGMFDVRTSVDVREDPTIEPKQASNDLEQTLVLWKRAGDGLVGAGGGLAFAFVSRGAAMVEVSAQQVFPFGAFVITPSAGLMLGF